MSNDFRRRPRRAGSQDEPFIFNKGIYGHKSVKSALARAQFFKCAYCEAEFDANSSGDVEHFRPKTYSKQAQRSEPIYPGYYWLAYEWSNLLYACEKCNRPIKRNLFPLRDPARRARRPTDDLNAEEPLLVNPVTENPREHIRFRLNKPFGTTSRGRATVRAMDLDRPELDGPRLRHIELVDMYLAVARMDPDAGSMTPNMIEKIRLARLKLKRLISQESIFSSMTRDLLAREGYDLNAA